MSVTTPEQLSRELARDRASYAVRREDSLARKATEIDHEIQEAEVKERKTAAKWARSQRARNAREMSRLSRTRQRAIISGTRARLTAEMNQSGEVRALRLSRLQTAVLCAGTPALLGFGAWSTGGVQAGTVELLNISSGSFLSFAAWGVEPALILLVAGIIIFKAILRSCGGEPTWKVSAVEYAALGMSLGLNAVSVPDGAGAGAFLTHSIGPLGVAGTAFAIGLLLKCIADTDPWKNAPRIAEMDFTVPELDEVLADPFAARAGITNDLHRQPSETSDETVTGTGQADTETATDAGSEPSPVTDNAGNGKTSVEGSDKAPRSNRDQGKRLTATARRDRGRKVPAVAKKSARRKPRTVPDLASDLDEAIRSGRLTESSSVNQVRLALECSPSRAKEAIDYRTSEAHRPRLAVVSEHAVNE